MRNINVGSAGRKPLPGAEDRRQSLAVMEAKVIKAIKVAAAEEDVTASILLERIAKEFLELRAGSAAGSVERMARRRRP